QPNNSKYWVEEGVPSDKQYLTPSGQILAQEGDPLGDAVGTADTLGDALEGDALGTSEGDALGTSEGDALGTADSLGDAVGTSEGDAVGTSEGDALGTADSLGDAVGTSEGDAVGTSEGDAVGTSEGDALGTSEGDALGTADSLGDALGDALAQSMYHLFVPEKAGPPDELATQTSVLTQLTACWQHCWIVGYVGDQVSPAGFCTHFLFGWSAMNSPIQVGAADGDGDALGTSEGDALGTADSLGDAVGTSEGDALGLAEEQERPGKNNDSEPKENFWLFPP
ncbi:hypothetical protein ACHAWC_000981, partial [Mediolabrus comicus]